MVKAVRVLMVICLMSLFFIHPAIAESETETVKGWYVGGSLGMTMQRDSDAKFPAAVNYSADLEFDMGLSLAGAVGYDFGAVRLETELSYQQSDIDNVIDSKGTHPASGDMSASALLLNGYWDFENSTRFVPFLTAGFGVAKVKINGFSSLIDVGTTWAADDSDTVFAYRFGAGVAYKINSNFFLDLTYRYFATAEGSFTDTDNDTFESELASHGLMFGIRYLF